jgi:hypothetical protein
MAKFVKVNSNLEPHPILFALSTISYHEMTRSCLSSIFFGENTCHSPNKSSARLQGGAPKIAKLVYNSNNYGL